jgi:hypothetical protein
MSPKAAYLAASAWLGLVLGLLGRLVAHVLQQRDLAVGQGRHGGLRGLADDVAGQLHVDAEQLAEAGGDGSQRVLGVDLALGAAEVGHDDDAGAGVAQRGQRRERGADAAVVGDVLLSVQRDVEVAADEDPLAREIAEICNRLH